MSVETSDEQCASQACQGDESALRALIERHSRQFYAVAYRVVLNQEHAEDVVQEAFVKLWTGKARWEEGKGAKFTTWFHRIVHNAAIDITRRKEHKVVPLKPEFDIKDERIDQEWAMQKGQEAEEVRQALESLPERQRMALTYVYYGEMKQAEIAEMMGVSLKALESLLVRGKTALRSYIEDQTAVTHG